LDYRFIGLLSVIGLLRWLCPQRAFSLFGALMSAALIGFVAPTSAVVVMTITLLFVYPAHRLMCYADARRWTHSIQRAIFLGAVFALVALLAVFKFHQQLSARHASGARLDTSAIELIGFSYFMFRVIGFLHVQSILKQPASPLTLVFYTMFPSTFTSGPIQKYQDFKRQTDSPAAIDAALLTKGVYRVTRGYFRKLVVAELFNRAVISVLALTPTVWTSGVAVLLLYLYFYFDFAGYSDLAVGFGLFLGINVPDNFRKPFTATTVSEFWRHYHITLVDWFRDHVFVPLGGLTGSRVRAALVAAVVMLLCGFWHGLTISFLAWGVWHGGMLFIEALMGSTPVPPSRRQGPQYWSRVLWTNARIAFGAIFFLPDPAATIRLIKGFGHLGLR